jgi:hypothetical protein
VWAEQSPADFARNGHVAVAVFANMAEYDSWDMGGRPVSAPAKAESHNDGFRRAVAHPRYGEAVRFAREYAGRNDFMMSMSVAAQQGRKFSDRMVEAVCKFIDRPAPAAPVTTGMDLTVLPKGSRYYAAENAEGGLSFVRVDNVAEGSWTGWVFVKAVIGPSEERIGSQKPGQRYNGQWQTVLTNVIADPVTALRRYGQEVGTCGVCHRRLTNEESRSYGIGPECRSKGGY